MNIGNLDFAVYLFVAIVIVGGSLIGLLSHVSSQMKRQIGLLKMIVTLLGGQPNVEPVDEVKEVPVKNVEKIMESSKAAKQPVKVGVRKRVAK